jgi:hypothetical protein
MPSRSEQREFFLAAHPKCAFCGGANSATTTEHCPPRALFQFKHWPEGFEFPACADCNHGTGDDDAAVAMLARMSPDGLTGNDDNRIEGLIHNVNRQFPGAFVNIIPTHTEARRRNRELGIKPGPGQSHQDVAPITLPEQVKTSVAVFARKLALATFYRETGTIFPSTGTLAMNWFTNVELVLHGRYKVFEGLKDIDGTSPPVVRGGKYLDDQFEYRLSLSSDSEVFLLQAKFGRSFGIVVFGCQRPGPIEETVEQLSATFGRKGPIEFIQSGPLHASGASQETPSK